MIRKSTFYKLTDQTGLVIAQGSAKFMRRLQREKQKTADRDLWPFRVWSSPSTAIGDYLGCDGPGADNTVSDL